MITRPNRKDWIDFEFENLWAELDPANDYSPEVKAFSYGIWQIIAQSSIRPAFVYRINTYFYKKNRSLPNPKISSK
jgi:hypothetical protein